MSNRQSTDVTLGEHAARRVAEVEVQRSAGRSMRTLGKITSMLGAGGVAAVPLVPIGIEWQTALGMASVIGLVVGLFATFATDNDSNFDEPLRHAVSDAIPEAWADGELEHMAKFIEELEMAGQRGLEEYERHAMQTLADEYGRLLLVILSNKPWNRLEKAMEVTMHGVSTDPEIVHRNYRLNTMRILKRIRNGMDWTTSRQLVEDEAVAAYPQVMRMAERFGLDMTLSKRSPVLPLPGERGSLTLPPPLPEVLLKEIERYRLADRSALRDEDRISGDALVRGDVPMMTQAWRRARMSSPDADHTAIDAHYETSAIRMAATLTQIFDHVAQDARQDLETADRYIRSKHGSDDPLGTGERP